MMRRTYIISILLVLAAALPVRAQNEISQAVEVERDYEGAVMDVVKSPIEPAVDDSLLNFKLNLDYTAFYSPWPQGGGEGGLSVALCESRRCISVDSVGRPVYNSSFRRKVLHGPLSQP